MRVMDFLNKKAVTADLKAGDKMGVLKEMVELLIKAGVLKQNEKDNIIEALKDREELGSTGIGKGIGIPHGKSDTVKELVGAFGLSRHGVDFESLDGDPVHIFFLLIAPEDSAGPHLKALARISRLLKEKYFRDMLRAAKDEKDIIRIITEEDQRRQ
ncbi:MAG: PTS sugar transporter subunit IIA [Candidatus Omnitrophota bacterium]